KDGYYRYSFGPYGSYNSSFRVYSVLKHNQIKSFITAFKENKRIPVADAKKLLLQ
ncbi:MAG: hypothetical protein HC896_16055, partial [Bacteroidales bacterium]|nr:hypothetical protein [Bacteroidales bacterium]